MPYVIKALESKFLMTLRKLIHLVLIFLITVNYCLGTDFQVEGIFGGPLLGVKGKDFLCLYDWEKNYFVQQIDVTANQVSSTYIDLLLSIGLLV